MGWIFAGAIAVAAAVWIVRRIVIPSADTIASIEAIARGGAPVPVRGEASLSIRSRRALSSIAERIAALESRAEAESASLRAILGSMSEGVFLIDSTRRIYLANESALAMFGIQTPPLGRGLPELLRNPEIAALVERAARSGKRESAELDHEVKRDSSYMKKRFQITAAPIPRLPGAREAESVVVAHDLTEIRRLEAVRKEFVANVSHEIRTPLAIITGYIETLMDGAIEDPALARGFLETMARHGSRLNLLIEDLLSLSRLESGGFQPQLSPASLREVIGNVVQQLDPRIKSAGALVTVSMPESLPEIRADSLRLEQLFFNLLENALKYGRAAAPKIAIEGRAAGDFVEVVVSDNGPGIPIHDQPHVFERFYRIHKDRSRDAGGTGLGLSIVKHIARIHGGSVTLRSVPGEGCAFTVRLPVGGPPPEVPPGGA